MRKKFLAGALALVILAGTIMAAGATSQAQALVSQSYLSGIFWNDLKAIVKQEVDRDTSAMYSEAERQAGQTAGGGGFTQRVGVNGNVVAGSTGCGLIWTEGSALVRSGTLVDATVGAELTTGGWLTVGHRYLAGTDVSLTVASPSARWMTEGTWSVTAGEPLPAALPFTDVARDAWYYENVA